MDDVRVPTVVEQARDVLMVWFDVSVPEADRLLRAWAGQADASVPELATALVFDILRGTPSGCHKQVLRYLEDNLRQLPSKPGGAPLAGPGRDRQG